MTSLPLRLVFLVAFLVSPSFAFADAVARAPTTCPAGSHLVTNHDGSDCAPDQCPASSKPGICDGRGCCRADLCLLPEGFCGDGLTCKVERVCAKPALAPPNNGFREIVGSCEGTGSCPDGSRCEVLPSCVRKESAFKACSCDLAQTQAPLGPPLLAFTIGVVALIARVTRTRKHSNGNAISVRG